MSYLTFVRPSGQLSSAFIITFLRQFEQVTRLLQFLESGRVVELELDVAFHFGRSASECCRDEKAMLETPLDN